MKKKLTIILLLIFAFTMSACVQEETAEQATKNALTAFKKMDADKIQNYFGPLNDFVDPSTSEPDPGTLELVKYLEFEILDSEEDDREAVVETKITNLDINPIMDTYYNEVMQYPFDEGISEEEMQILLDDLLVEVIKESDQKTFTTIVDVYLRKVEDEWKIHLSEDLMNALLGRKE